jgi:5'-3' exonuclease
MKITHTETPMITTTGFLPDETTARNDEYHRQQQARKQAKREQNLELLMLLSALESAFFASKTTMPDYLIERIDKAVELLKNEVLNGVGS